ncbi:ExbD/TolR family protein [Roseovarius aquimarinus]|uniref:ExbD/TolR family protein n=1 Tax=Roseovarius aquimarinus TaxID=1229156 RepID=A0ABW7I7J8_9RHOB
MIRRPRRSKAEPTIALINIVFLMLIFFMISGTLARPLDPSLKLIDTADLEGRAPPDALVVHADGRLSYEGRDVATPAAHVETLAEGERREIRIVPDRALPAETLVEIARALRAAGAERVMIVTERGLE